MTFAGHRLVGRIEVAESLDGWSDRIRSIVDPLVGRGTRRDALTGRWLGHPAHPALVVVPTACWMSAVVIDVMGGKGADRIARRLIGVGVIGVIPAAASGAADWLDTGGAERRVGTVHAIANNVAALAFGASWLARRYGQGALGRALSGFGIGVTACAGYLGGHMAYSRGVGVNTAAFQSGPTDWTPLCAVDGLATEGVARADLGPVGFAVVRREGGFDVVEDRCTHRGGPLSGGPAADGCIECPWHGSRFATGTGEVLAGPASVPQPAYESRVRHGVLEIRRTEHGSLRRNPVGASTSSATEGG